MEPLEQRTLLAGVTLITHGFELNGNESDLTWCTAMAQAIAVHAGPGTPIFDIVVTASATSLQQVSGQPVDANPGGDVVIFLDWSALSNNFSYNTASIAIAVAPLFTQSFPAQGIDHPLGDLPIHLIGHSRGGSLVSALSADLGAEGIWVDQLTTLDPHPVQSPLLINVPDPSPSVYSNVLFADNYYETDDTSLITGESISGAHNVNLNSPLSSLSPTAMHQHVHSYYYGTINTAATNDGDGVTIPSAWYNYAGTGPRNSIGFAYSLIAGGTRPSDGLGARFGGQGVRTALPATGGSQWPNIDNLFLTDSGSTFPVGQTLHAKYLFESDSAAPTVSFYLDSNQNPFDASGAYRVGSQNFSLGSGVLQPTNATQLNTSNVPAGKYYLMAKISDGPFTRYAYDATTVTLTAHDLAAANRTAYASVGAGIGNIVDGKSSTEWTSGNVSSKPSQWVFVDLGGACNINEIKLNWDTSYPGSYKIRLSNDSVNWVDFTSVLAGASGTKDLTGLNGNGRYVMVQLFSLSAGHTGYAFKDLQVFGGNDLAVNRTVYASSGSSSAANAIGTSGTDDWISSGSTNQWLFVDLGEVFNINQANVTFDGDYASTFSIYTSCDTVNWTPVTSIFAGHSGLNSITGFDGDGRYVMLSMPTANNGVDDKVSDFEVNGGVNLALNRSTTATTATSSSTTGAAAVDGNAATAWTSSSAGTQWIYTDLGAAYDVTRVRLSWGSDYASQFQIQISADASNWTTLYTNSSFTGGVLDQGGIYGDGRYVRVLCTAGPSSNYSLSEFEVYGSANLGLDRPATSSSNTVAHGAGYATDMDPITSWITTAAGTQSITVDLGSSFNIPMSRSTWAPTTPEVSPSVFRMTTPTGQRSAVSPAGTKAST